MDDFINKFWDLQAKKYNSSPKASWSDTYMLELEKDVISRYLSDGIKVLDVGCANGFALINQVKKHNLTSAYGVDFAEEMIKVAKTAIKGESSQNIKNIEFQVADVRELPFQEGFFDVTYTTRVIINLPTWEDQLKGIKECIRVTRLGGLVLLSEGFYEPLVRLNAHRSLLSLQPLEEHDFNRYLKEYKLREFLDREGIQYDVVNFSSLYYFGTRVLRELFESDNSYENEFNRYFLDLQRKYTGGDFGIQKLFVLRV